MHKSTVFEGTVIMVSDFRIFFSGLGFRVLRLLRSPMVGRLFDFGIEVKVIRGDNTESKVVPETVIMVLGLIFQVWIGV
jgi:hypothetical protein